MFIDKGNKICVYQATKNRTADLDLLPSYSNNIKRYNRDDLQ